MSTDNTQPHTVIEGEIVTQSPPTEVTQKYSVEVAAEIFKAFHNKYNVSEACAFAGISRMTYYRWLEAHPEFALKVEEARAMPNRRAKEVVIEAINSGDVNTARWLLDRTDPDFKPKIENENTHELKQTREKIKDFLDEPDEEYDAGSEQPTAATDSAEAGEVSPTTPDIS